MDTIIRFSPIATGRVDQAIGFAFTGVSPSVQVAGFGITPTTRAPVIAKVPPNVVAASPVIVEGRNFGFTQGNSSITLAGAPVQVVSWYDTLVKFVVPIMDPSVQDLRITTSRGSAVAALNVLGQAPIISKLGDASLSPGSSLAIWGQNFGTQQGGSVVSIAGVPAQVSQWNDKFIVAKVPAVKVGQYDVTVTTSNGLASTVLRVRNIMATVTYNPCAIAIDFSAYFGRRLSPI